MRGGTVIYDPVCHADEHAPFNAALIKTVLAAYPGEEVVFAGDRENGQRVRQLFERHCDIPVQWVPIRIAPRRCNDWRTRFGMEWRVCGAVMDQVRRYGAVRLIASIVTEPGLLALKAHLWLRAGAPTTIVVLHSILESLLAGRRGRAVLRYASGNGLRYLVLGPHIRDEMLRALPPLSERVYWLGHPYLFGHPRAANRLSDVITFGFLGLGSERKGLDTFSRLAKEVSESIPDSRQVRFELVGRLAPEYIERATPDGFKEYVHVALNTHAFIPRDVYEDQVDQLTYTVFPYDHSRYRLVSSGAILDSFASVKPCIVLRCPLFEYYFSRMGDIGYMCDNYADLKNTVRGIVANPPHERYTQQCRNILCGRTLCDPETLKSKLVAAFQ